MVQVEVEIEGVGGTTGDEGVHETFNVDDPVMWEADDSNNR